VKILNDANNTVSRFAYDALGRMITADKDVNSTTISEIEYAYNDIGKVTDANQKLFAGTNREIDYTYDQTGHPNSIKYPTNTTIYTPRNWQGKISSIQRSQSYIIADYQYVGSWVAKREYPQISVAYQPEYDNLGRITCADSGTGFAEFDYTFEQDSFNIARQRYDHRDNDPCTNFTYDNLDRLTEAEYDIGDNNEAFTMDKLGNREKVNVKSGADVNYAVDELTNRYKSVGSDSLAYDAAGNLTLDKDGYKYKYDYENRIVKITKDGNDIAKFAYDALGRRIRKTDHVADTNTLYYYNTGWQVLSEYDGAGNHQQSFAYGNYIDEVVYRWSGGPHCERYYVHDHLYSPVVLINGSGSDIERYEYDAYGNPHILNADFSDDADGLSDYDNPYYFTGRRVDFLDNGNLVLQYNRHRYYDYYTGRWLTHDPLGIITSGGKANTFNVASQYRNGLNLYSYLRGNPFSSTDPYGLYIWGHADIDWDINWDECWPTASVNASGKVKTWKWLRYLGEAEGHWEINGELHNWTWMEDRNKCQEKLTPWVGGGTVINKDLWPPCSAWAELKLSGSAPDASGSAKIRANVYCSSWLDSGVKGGSIYKAQVTKKIWRNCKCGDITLKGKLTINQRTNLVPPVLAAGTVGAVAYAGPGVAFIVKSVVKWLTPLIPAGAPAG